MTQPDISAFSQVFSQNGVLTLQNVLPTEIAEGAANEFSSLNWILQVNDYTDEPRLEIPLSEISNRDNLIDILYSMKHSIDLDKLFYIRLAVDAESLVSDSIRQVCNFLNTDNFIAQCRTISGLQDINRAWIEATCYDKGCFLGNHSDDHHPDNRVAFVLNLTQSWKSDWGGLLMLENDPGSQPIIIPPLWNSLTLFKVPQKHTVTAVTQAATEHRYSITGWLRP